MSDEHERDSLEGIPDSGRERLAQNREGLFTSDLTVNEFMLIAEAGFDPLGLVGVDLQEKTHGWGSHIIEFFAIGTAIVPQTSPVSIGAPTPVLDLNDR